MQEVLKYVDDLSKPNLNYVKLKFKLELRFDENLLFQSYYSLLTHCKQKLGEDEATMGTDLERLSQLANRECLHPICDKIACAQLFRRCQMV